MAVKVGKYHLFQRQLNTGTFWYYWYYDEEKKQVQKACGFGCEDKRDAVAFLEDLLKADLLEEKRKEKLKEKTFSQFAQDMFLEVAAHLERWLDRCPEIPQHPGLVFSNEAFGSISKYPSFVELFRTQTEKSLHKAIRK